MRIDLLREGCHGRALAQCVAAKIRVAVVHEVRNERNRREIRNAVDERKRLPIGNSAVEKQRHRNRTRLERALRVVGEGCHPPCECRLTLRRERAEFVAHLQHGVAWMAIAAKDKEHVVKLLQVVRLAHAERQRQSLAGPGNLKDHRCTRRV